MAQQDTPSRYLDKFMLRMPDGMRDRIAEAAKENGRSMNSEIVHRLEASFSEDGYVTGKLVAALADLKSATGSILKMSGEWAEEKQRLQQQITELQAKLSEKG